MTTQWQFSISHKLLNPNNIKIRKKRYLIIILLLFLHIVDKVLTKKFQPPPLFNTVKSRQTERKEQNFPRIWIETCFKRPSSQGASGLKCKKHSTPKYDIFFFFEIFLNCKTSWCWSSVYNFINVLI